MECALAATRPPAEGSGVFVGIELPLQRGDAILQQQLAFFQAAQRQLVVDGGYCQTCDGFVEVAMLGTQLDQLGEQSGFFGKAVVGGHERMVAVPATVGNRTIFSA
jgi:hypothetical protein